MPAGAVAPDLWLASHGQGASPGGRDPVGGFPLVVSGRLDKGEFVVFGGDALFQNQFLAGDNLQLARNLAAWLCGGTGVDT